MAELAARVYPNKGNHCRIKTSVRIGREVMSYYIREEKRNWARGKRVVIHASDCYYCRKGRGTGRAFHGNGNTEWRGPFETLEDAEEFAKDFPRIEYCRRCFPET